MRTLSASWKIEREGGSLGGVEEGGRRGSQRASDQIEHAGGRGCVWTERVVTRQKVQLVWRDPRMTCEVWMGRAEP